MRHTLSGLAPCALLLALSACAGTPAEGRWVGTLTPEPGSAPAPGCRAIARSVLTVRGTEATFVPDETTIVLSGLATPDGRVRATRTTQGADRKPYLLVFEGQATDKTLTGTYAAPRCRAKVDLLPF